MNGKKSDFISVSELAKKVEKSQQYVYKLIKTKPSFREYVKSFDGKKMIHKSALSEYFGIVDDKVEETDKTVEQPGINQDMLKLLSDQVQDLRQQISVKDQQIADQAEQIRQITLALRSEQLTLARIEEQLLLVTKPESDQEPVQEEKPPKTEEPAQEQPQEQAKPLSDTKPSFMDRLRQRFTRRI